MKWLYRSMPLLELEDASPYPRVLVTGPPVVISEKVPEASSIDSSRYPSPSGELLIQEFVVDSGRLRSSLPFGGREITPEQRLEVIDALALRNLKLTDFMRGRVNISALNGKVTSLSEEDLKPGKLEETITNSSIDLSIFVRSVGMREAVLQGIVDQKEIDQAVMNEYGISVEEVAERMPELEKNEDGRRREEWILQETMKMQVRARRLEERKAKEQRKKEGEEKAKRLIREGLMRVGSSRTVVPVAS